MSEQNSVQDQTLQPPQWDQIETVLLDMDGTLLDLHFDSHFWLEHLPERYAQLHKLDQASAREHVLTAIRSQQGTLNWYSLDYWAERFQVDIVALKKEVQHLIGFRSDARHLLEFLQQHKARVVLATNSDQHGLSLKLPPTGLDQLVDDIVSSADFGIAKEEPEFWKALQGVVPYNPETTLLIDDNEQVLDSAQSFGIRYLYTILQPDMASPERKVTRYPGVRTFDQITR